MADFPRVDPQQMLRDLRELATFGALCPGVERRAFSVEDCAAREWLADRMRVAGLETRIDGIGNVYGRTPGVMRAVLLGSHTDTVPRGGWLDGAYGVIAGLAVARACADASFGGPVGVDVISFADEEGAFIGTLGSASFCDELHNEDLRNARDATGQSLSDVLAAAGYAGRPFARVDPGRTCAYLELHIEQGRRLEAAGKRIGVVTGIAGMRRRSVVFIGRADHAGTTPMQLRRDAGAALIRYAAEAVEAMRSQAGPDTVWNLARVTLEPGASNVVPGRGELLLEHRDLDNAVMKRLDVALAELEARIQRETGIEVAGRTLAARDGAPTDAHLASVIEAAAAGHSASAIRMASGAGHDARVLAQHVPAGMAFVPSIGGHSHDVAENTSDDDLALGVEVLATATQTLLAETACAMAGVALQPEPADAPHATN